MNQVKMLFSLILLAFSMGGFMVCSLFAQEVAGTPSDAAETTEASHEEGYPFNLGRMLQRVVVENRRVVDLQAAIEALREKERAVVIFKDPMVAISYSNVPWDNPVLGESPMSGLQLHLEQVFPHPGKNARRRAVVEAERTAAENNLEELKIMLQGQVAGTYYRLTLVRQLRGIVERHIVLVTQFLEAVQAKYESGKANQHDVMRLVVLRDKLRDDLDDFTQQAQELTAAINGVLHRDVQIPIATPASISLLPVELKQDKLIALAEADRPLLKALAEKAKMKRLAARQARIERYPDIKAWSDYRFREAAGNDDGTDFISLGVGVAIPFDFLNRFEARARQKEKESKSILYRADGIRDEIAAGVAASLSKWRRAWSKAKRYRATLVPEAQKTLDAAFAAYQTDRVEFASLYQAELQLLQFDREVLISTLQTRLMATNIGTLTGNRSLIFPAEFPEEKE